MSCVCQYKHRHCFDTSTFELSVNGKTGKEDTELKRAGIIILFKVTRLFALIIVIVPLAFTFE